MKEIIAHHKNIFVLPPYTPHYNVIESIFGLLKRNDRIKSCRNEN